MVTVVRAGGAGRGEAYAKVTGCGLVGWNAVADAYRKEGEYGDVFRVAKGMRRGKDEGGVGVGVDDFTMQTLMRSRNGAQGVRRIWRMATDRGYLRGQARFASYVRELGRFDARAALAELRRYAENPKANVKTKTFNALLSVLTSPENRARHTDDAVELVRTMKAEGPSPDSVTLTEVMKALATTKAGAEACAVRDELVGPLEARQSYDGRFVNAFLRCYGEDVR